MLPERYAFQFKSRTKTDIYIRLFLSLAFIFMSSLRHSAGTGDHSDVMVSV